MGDVTYNVKPRRAMPTAEERAVIEADPQRVACPYIAPDGSCDADDLRAWRKVQAPTNMPERMSPSEIPNGGMGFDD